MNVTISYRKVERPIDKVILELTEKEAFVIKMLVGSIIGGGEIRTITDNIYHTLKDIKLGYEFDTPTFFKESIALSACSEANLRKLF
jgi:hypothetical protein